MLGALLEEWIETVTDENQHAMIETDRSMSATNNALFMGKCVNICTSDKGNPH